MRDGIDLVEIHNGAFSYSVLLTRGMGLWRGEYRGNFLGWRAPVLGPVERRLTSEQYLDAIAQVTGYWPKPAVMNVAVKNPHIRAWRYKKPA